MLSLRPGQVDGFVVLVTAQLSDRVVRLGDGQELAKSVVVYFFSLALEIFDLVEVTCLVVAVVGYFHRGDLWNCVDPRRH
jgi:uncharacterized membrane protein